jgi:class 3 adenylate cyclase/tetratricopeptide (TPR) repeat protein
MVAEHASRLAVGWVADPAAPPWRELRGSAVLADLTGFTRLSEQLAGAGAEGSELLHQVMTACFTAVLAGSVEAGGDIIGFAGDSALVWFDADEHEDHLVRALEAASRMSHDLQALPIAMTRGRRLRVSTGVHSGTFHASLVGRSRRWVVWCGPEMSQLSALEAAANPGQVVVSRSVADAVRPSWRGRDVPPGVELRRTGRRHRRAIAPRPRRLPNGAEGPARSLTSPRVHELIDHGVTAGDHRTVSIGFVRIGGLDELLATRGPEELHLALERVADLVSGAADDQGVELLDVDVGVGSVKLLLAAGAPRALEHDEERLLRSLHRILDECELPASAGAQRGRVFAALLGVPGRRTYTLMGDPVNVAARALALAGPGELVAADGLGVGDRPVVAAEPLGRIPVKNRTAPVEMWRVSGVVGGGLRTTRRRARAASVTAEARRDESRDLAAAWKRTVDGHGSAVALVGEPGMGASDLLAELVDLAGGSAVSLVADPSRRHVPLEGIASLAASLAELDAGETHHQPDPWTWLAGHLGALPPTLAEWTPEVLALLGQDEGQREVRVVDPLTSARRTRMVLAALLEAALPVPCLLALDDVDLFDEASQLVLAQLCTSTSRRPLMVATSRSPGSAALSESEHVVELEPLSVEAATDVVAELAPRLRDDQIARIVEAASGNLFVLGELARHPADGELPDSLHRLGAWLIDALSPSARALVCDVSIIGTTVHPETAAALLGRPELAVGAESARHELWVAVDSVLGPAGDGTLVFRHEAYRRVAYEMLPFRRRRELHSAIADQLADSATAVAGNRRDAVLALHLDQAGRIDEAYPLAVRAGQRAKASGALAEAVDLLARATTMARTIDRDSLARLLLDEGEARRWLGDADGADRCFRRAGSAVSDPIVAARMCHLRADLALRRGKFRAAKSWAERGLAVTAPLADDAVEVRCHLMLDLAARLDQSGRHLASLPLAEAALGLAHDHGVRLLEGLAHLHLEMAYSAMVDPKAVEHGDVAVAIFEELGHDRFLESALNNSGLTAMYLGNWEDAIERYRRSIDCAVRVGQTVASAVAIGNVGFLLYRQGRHEEADGYGRRAVRLLDNADRPALAAIPRLLRAMVAAAQGRFADADTLVAEARAAFVQVDDAAMVVDCDVTTMDCLVRARRFEDAVALGLSLVDRLGPAEPEVVITHGRLLGSAEVAIAGGELTGGGVARIQKALARARSLHLLYEVHQCLTALVDIAAAGGPGVADSLRSERDEVAARLGIVDTA